MRTAREGRVVTSPTGEFFFRAHELDFLKLKRANNKGYSDGSIKHWQVYGTKENEPMMNHTLSYRDIDNENN